MEVISAFKAFFSNIFLPVMSTVFLYRPFIVAYVVPHNFDFPSVQMKYEGLLRTRLLLQSCDFEM